jgi:helicase
MKTSDFSFVTMPFDTFNPPQAEAVKFATQDCNLVVSLSTAVGKTAIAMCFLGHELKTQERTKCVYVSPLRAISEEKFKQFKEVPEWSGVPIMINTGDHLARREDFEAARLIIMTTETLDSKARNKDIHGDWLKQVGVLVLDELHLLGDEKRGAALEAGLVNFTSCNSSARIVGLSATMSNHDEIASWLKSLNNKSTYVVNSPWRPGKLITKLVGVEDDRSFESVAQDVMIDILHDHRGEKIIVFVHTKKIGRKLTQLLKNNGFKCEFYHAGLIRQERELLEQTFLNANAGLNILVTTSALAMGVNL